MGPNEQYETSRWQYFVIVSNAKCPTDYVGNVNNKDRANDRYIIRRHKSLLCVTAGYAPIESADQVCVLLLGIKDGLLAEKRKRKLQAY